VLHRESTEEAERRRKELLERLAAAYPYMFRRMNGREDFFRFNPAIGAGWFDIFERLCAAINEALTAAQKKRFRIVQVKEKFGGLRVYWRIGSRARLWADIQVPGEGVITLKPKAKKSSVAARIDQLITHATAEAANTCEACGRRPAKLHLVDGWFTTMCDEHRPKEHGDVPK
jgi:hypothetical protein